MAPHRPITSTALARTKNSICVRCQFRRGAHSIASQQTVPSPTPFVPDAPSFLSLIGRGLAQHSSKIPDWQSLFTLTGKQLRELGVEPARSRKYLIWWRDRFRRGVYGPGGDLKIVNDGQAELRIAEIPRQDAEPTMTSESIPPSLAQPLTRIVVNETEESLQRIQDPGQLHAIKGMRVKGHGLISGPFAFHAKEGGGRIATIKRQAGMWEIKRGTKVDGGERRRKEMRRKRVVEQNK